MAVGNKGYSIATPFFAVDLYIHIEVEKKKKKIFLPLCIIVNISES